MYDRFSRESMEIIAFSQEEAEEWRHSYVGTEHLLLAFLRTKENNVFRFLTTHGVTYEKVAALLESEKGRGKVRLSADDLEPTPRLKRVMKISFEEAHYQFLRISQKDMKEKLSKSLSVFYTLQRVHAVNCDPRYMYLIKSVSYSKIISMKYTIFQRYLPVKFNH